LEHRNADRYAAARSASALLGRHEDQVAEFENFLRLPPQVREASIPVVPELAEAVVAAGDRPGVGRLQLDAGSELDLRVKASEDHVEIAAIDRRIRLRDAPGDQAAPKPRAATASSSRRSQDGDGVLA